MKLFHTSPSEITKVDHSGRFGEFLCFAVDPYVMSACETITYSIELNEDDIVEARTFFYRDDCEKLAGIIEEVMELVGCDEDTAENLLAGTESLADVTDFDAETDWDIQKMTGEAGKLLGYRAVMTEDEQGSVYLVAMAGRESELSVSNDG